MGMTVLKIPNEKQTKLFTTGSSYISLNFNFMNMEYDRNNVQLFRWVKPEIYKWLNDTIGEHVGCYRVCHRFFIYTEEINEIRKTRFKSYEEWDALNPVIPMERWNRWSWVREDLAFADPADAALFKLTWF